MKSLIIILTLIVSTTAFSQTKRDYENFMHKFQIFYNANKADSLCNLGSEAFNIIRHTLFTANDMVEYKKEYGNIVSYKYLTVDTVSDKSKNVLFKVVASQKTFIMAFRLNKNNKYDQFNFHKNSAYARAFLLKD